MSELPDLRQVYIRSANYDGTPHWEHPAWLVRHEDGIVVTRTSSGLLVAREGGSYTSPFNTRGHYWSDRWFNVIRLEDPGDTPGAGRLSGFYCNIATPVEFDGENVRYVDLQLDVRVFADENGTLTYRILDEDEFDAARERYRYPDDLIERARRAVDQVISLIEGRQFPFDA